MVINIFKSRVLFLDFVEVGVWHALEHESHDTVAELTLGFVIPDKVALKRVDNMHLQIQKLAIDRVLRWGMEMILHSVKLS